MKGFKMDRFFNSIGEIFRVIPRMATEELRGLRNSIFWLIGFLYALSLFQLAMNNYTISSVFGFIIFVLSIPVIFNIRRIINLTVAGEALEALRITPVAQTQQAQQGSARLIINPLSTIFWGISLQIFFFVLIFSLATPLLPLRNNPMFVVLFPSMAIAIAIAFKGTALRIVNWTSSFFVLALFLVHASLLFVPNAQTSTLGKVLGAYSNRSEVSARQKIQTQRTWQIPAGTTVIYDCQNAECSPKSIPKYNKPTEIVSLNDSVESKSGIIYEKFSFPDPDTGQPGKFEGYIPSGTFSEKEPGRKKELGTRSPELIDTIRISDRPFPRQFKEQLSPGRYALKPANNDRGKSYVRLVQGDKRIEMEETDGEYSYFTVPSGQKAYCLGSDWDIVRLYVLN